MDDNRSVNFVMALADIECNVIKTAYAQLQSGEPEEAMVTLGQFLRGLDRAYKDLREGVE